MSIDYSLRARIAFFLLCISQLHACGTPRWYSVEQQPAEPFAYIHDSVFLSRGHIRVASIRELDGDSVANSSRKGLKINTGIHQVKISCDEAIGAFAKGAFDSEDLTGQAKVLAFEANIQRKYKVFCQPFTHWWIEDLGNGSVVAGEKPASQGIN